MFVIAHRIATVRRATQSGVGEHGDALLPRRGGEELMQQLGACRQLRDLQFDASEQHSANVTEFAESEAL